MAPSPDFKPIDVTPIDDNDIQVVDIVKAQALIKKLGETTEAAKGIADLIGTVQKAIGLIVKLAG